MVYLTRAGKKVNRSEQSNYLNYRNFFTIFYDPFNPFVNELDQFVLEYAEICLTDGCRFSHLAYFIELNIFVRLTLVIYV